MTVPFSSNIYPAVAPGGEVNLVATFQTYLNSGQNLQVTGVSLDISPAAGGASVATLTPTSQDGSTWTVLWAPATTVQPGDYTLTWTGTATSGPAVVTQNLLVAAIPKHSPSPGVYATAQQYQAWSGDLLTPPGLVDTWLRRASEVIDNALVGAVYVTDVDGMPLDAATMDVFMRATCAQAEFMIANNDRANVKWQYSSTSAGGVSVTRAPGTTAPTMPKLAPQAAAILRVAGVLPGAPLISW